MSAFRVDELDARRQHKQSQVLLGRMTRALMQTYAVNRDAPLAWCLQVDPSLPNDQAIAQWIKRSLNVLDVETAEAVFSVLCSRFERCLSQMPQHLHGGVQ